VPRFRFERARLRQPPKVIGGRGSQAAESQLRPLARRRVIAHLRHEGFERLEMLAQGCRTEPCVEHLLADGTFGAVQD
jgi:hypothetical protein